VPEESLQRLLNRFNVSARDRKKRRWIGLSDLRSKPFIAPWNNSVPMRQTGGLIDAIGATETTLSSIDYSIYEYNHC